MSMQLIDHLASWDNHLIDSISNSLYSHIDIWLTVHPLFHWLISHFVISTIIVCIVAILIIRLLLTIYHSIAAIIDKMWLWILRSPFLLLKFLFGWEIKSNNDLENTTITNYEITHDSEQIQEILIRLTQIQQQQKQIIQDIAYLKKRELNIKPKKINLQRFTATEKPPVIES